MLSGLLTLLPDANTSGNRFTYDLGLARTASREPVYGLPAELIEVLHHRIKPWFTPEELDQERRFSSICRNLNAIGFSMGWPVRHSYFPGLPGSKLSSEDVKHLSELDWTDSACAKVRAVKLADMTETLDPLRLQKKAYIAWLITNPQFLTEQNDLRHKWRDVLVGLDSLPQYPFHRVLVQWPRSKRSLQCQAADFLADFAAFYERWILHSFVTWDLPEPRAGDLGVPVSACATRGLTQYSAIQLSPIFRVSGRFPLHRFLQHDGEIGTHLAEWVSIQQEQHPSGLNYTRLGHLLDLHVLRNIILASRYGSRFRRREGQLDEVFADYFGESSDSVKKLRHWIDRRLQRRQGDIS